MAGRSLDLYSEEVSTELSNKVVVGTVEQRLRDDGADFCKPCDIRNLAKISLGSRTEMFLHERTLVRREVAKFGGSCRNRVSRPLQRAGNIRGRLSIRFHPSPRATGSTSIPSK